jgi:hypothetical protein
MDIFAFVRDIEGAVPVNARPAGMPPVLKNSEAFPSGVSLMIALVRQLTKKRLPSESKAGPSGELYPEIKTSTAERARGDDAGDGEVSPARVEPGRSAAPPAAAASK